MLIIGIVGASGSGKTTIAKKLCENYAHESIYINEDSYYQDTSHFSLEQRMKLNFDTPESMDHKLLIEDLYVLKAGQPIPKRTCSYETGRSEINTGLIKPNKILFLEGLFLFNDKELNDLIDVKVYVNVSKDISLMRRLQRNQQEQRISFETDLKLYEKNVRPGFFNYIKPCKQIEGIIIIKNNHSPNLTKVKKEINHHLELIAPTTQESSVMNI